MFVRLTFLMNWSHEFIQNLVRKYIIVPIRDVREADVELGCSDETRSSKSIRNYGF